MNKINLTICGLILFFIILIGLYFHQKGSTLVKVNEGFNSTPTVSPSPVTTSLSTTLPSTTLPGYYLTFQYNKVTYYLQEPTTINEANMYYTSNINDATTFNMHNPETKNRYFTIVNPKNQAGGPNKPFSLVIFFDDVMLTDISNLQSQITSGNVNYSTSTGPIRYQLKGFQSPKTWLFITPTLTTASHGSTVSPAPPTPPPHGSTISPAPPAHSPHGSTVSPAPVTPHHHGSTVSPAPVTHSPSGSSPHTYTHCHTHSDPNHSHTPSNSINVVVSKYTKNIGT